MDTDKRKLLAVAVVLSFLMAYSPIVSATSWWNSSWGYCKTYTVPQTAGAGVNYTVNLNVTYGSGSDSGNHVYCSSHCRTNFGDLRFIANDNTTALNYWIENYTTSGWANVWINLGSSNLTSGSVSIEMYYGNAAVTTTANGTNTFIFFDDFENNNLNRWSSYSSVVTESSVVCEGAYAANMNNGAQGSLLENFTSISTPITYSVMVHVDAYIVTSSSYGGYPILLGTNASNMAYSLVASSTTWSYYQGSYTGWSSNNSLSLSTWYSMNVGYNFTEEKQYGFRNQDGMGTIAFKDTTGTNVTGIYQLSISGGSLAAWTMYVDSVFIRKWVSSGDPVGSWSAEQAAPTSSVPTCLTTSATTTLPGNTTTAYSYWNDSGATLSGYIIGTNLSGTMTNGSWTTFSGTPGWANTTFTLPSSMGIAIVINFYANDSGNNWASASYTITTQIPGEITVLQGATFFSTYLTMISGNSSFYCKLIVVNGTSLTFTFDQPMVAIGISYIQNGNNLTLIATGVGTITFYILFSTTGPPSSGVQCYATGMQDLRNATINIGNGIITVTYGTQIDNSIWFTGNIASNTLVWVADNVWIQNTTIGSSATVLTYSVGSAIMTNWGVYYFPQYSEIILRTNVGIPTSASLTNFSGFSTLYFTIFGILGYAPILLFPITIYFKTRSVGALAISLLFMAAVGGVGTGIGIFLPDAIRPFVVLAISLAIGLMLYRIFWGGSNE